MQKLLFQPLFIGCAHVEQCSMFVQELLENTNRSSPDVIVQFYVFCVYPTLSLLQNHTQNGYLKLPNAYE